MTIEDERKEERRFMHDLANPIGIAYGKAKLLKRLYDLKQQDSEKAQSLLESMIKALERVSKQMKDRREVLVSRNDDPPPPAP